ncbi:putative membrane protein SpoIIM required for sporulation [Spinactinospora alkalitolerans]|uniref:Putative membrane protein SpoIIM required for sporulation n=1 Tax=Spinactinospora alkalitolerans TaxID=687207 RepID=A0A852U2K1_9ACTN|nr:stage II sporulation protein M [Spinactinospora alkalitolerans]NYE49652.1 putative membrane protein SpoIIM required for sporulation [Spinactinospora alkalitolerans]
MDLDVFAAAHRPDWDRLQDLVRRRRRLSGPEIDELVDLYQRVSTHLSVVRSARQDPALVGWLSGLVARARSAVTGAHAPAWRDSVRFFTRTFPAVVYRLRWWWIAASLGTVAFSTAVAVWIVADPAVQAAIGAPEEIRAYVENDFANYYVEHPGASFAARVWTNNAWAAAQALIFGVFLCLPTVYVLALNGANIGVAAGLMFANGKGDIFLGLIIPHGLLELTAVFVAAGVGLKLGWTVIDPGRRPRLQALGEEARAAIAVVLGLVLVLFVSGLIEGLVTGWVHTTWLRIGIGVAAEALFLAYVYTLGRKAYQEGETGDIRDRPATAPVAG